MSTLRSYREDGLLARALGRLPIPLPASLLVLAAIAPLAVAIATSAEGQERSAAVIGWLVLIGGLSRGARLETDRFAWAVPALLRAGEYAAYVWLSPKGAIFLLVVLAFHHYDRVYRLRYQSRTPPDLGGGWEIRLIGAWILSAAGALPGGFLVAAGILGTLFAAEAVASWTNHDPEQGAPAA